MLTGFSRQCEETCSKCRPRRLAGEVGDDLVGLAVECSNNLRPDEVLGCHLEPVSVALDGVEQSGGWIVEFSQQTGGGGGSVIASEDLLQGLSGGARSNGFGSDEGVGVVVADDLEVEVVTRPRVNIVYSCCRDSSPVNRPCMVSAVTPWAAWTVVA
jgi:hypothetical protein